MRILFAIPLAPALCGNRRRSHPRINPRFTPFLPCDVALGSEGTPETVRGMRVSEFPVRFTGYASCYTASSHR